jgi:hypothetical protein
VTSTSNCTDCRLDLVGLEAEGHGAADAGEGGDVVELLDDAVEAQPVGGVAAAQVEDHEAAAGLGAAGLELLAELEVGEGAAAAELGEADEGVVADEGEAAGVAGAEVEALDGARLAIDATKIAGARLKEVEVAAVEARAVRHGEAAGEDPIGGEVEEDAAVSPPIAPTIRDVAVRDSRDVGRAARFHGEAVEVRAILRGEAGDPRRAPEGAEAVGFADGGEAGEEGVDEDRAALTVDGDVVDVEVAGGVADRWDIKAVVAVVALARGEVILEAGELVVGGEPEGLGGGVQAHAAAEAALVDGELVILGEAQQEELAGLVGGEGEAEPLLREPGGQAGGGGEIEGGGAHPGPRPRWLRGRGRGARGTRG